MGTTNSWDAFGARLDSTRLSGAAEETGVGPARSGSNGAVGGGSSFPRTGRRQLCGLHVWPGGKLSTSKDIEESGRFWTGGNTGCHFFSWPLEESFGAMLTPD